MPLTSQTMPIPFQLGINEKVDPRQISPGTQTSLVNGVFNKSGAIEKRFGYSALLKTTVTGGSVASSLRLGNLDKALSLVDGHDYYTYSDTAGIWSQVDRVPEPFAYRDPVVEWTNSVACFDVTVANGYKITAWCSNSFQSGTNYTVYASVQDVATGQYLFQNYVVAQGGGVANYKTVRCCTCGNYAVLVYSDTTSGNTLYGIALNTTAMTWGSAGALTTNYTNLTAAMDIWDVCGVTSTVFALVYPQGATGVSAVALFTASTMGAGSTSTLAPVVGHNRPGHGFGIASDGTRLWIAAVYDTGANNDVYVSSWTASPLSQTLAETTIGQQTVGTASHRISICPLNSTTAVVAHSKTTDTSVGVRWAQITTAGTVSASNRRLYGHALAGKIFVVDSRAYAVVACSLSLVAYSDLPPVTNVSNQGAYILLDLDVSNTGSTQQAGRPVAINGPRIANTTVQPYTDYAVVVNSSQVSSTKWISIGTYAGSTSSRWSLQHMIYDFAATNRWEHAQLGNVTYISGGILNQFDGQSVTEVGFLHPPPTVSAAGSNGGSMTLLGSYTYYVAYGWTDSKGNLHLSSSSVASVTLTGIQQTVTLTVSNLTNTTRQDVARGFNPPVQIYVWRNVNGGSVFYRTVNDASAPVNDPTTLSQTIVDTISDSTLSVTNNFGQWPFSGGQLEGYVPSSVCGLLTHNNRLFAVLDDQITWGFSTEAVVGEQVRFSDQLRLTISDGGPITGWGSMDGALFTFKQSKIFVTTGQGPDERGLNSDLTTRELPSDVGCIEPRSVLVTPLGIMFQARTGIYLIARGGNTPTYFGAAVEDQLANFPIIKSASLVARRQEARFECVASETSASGVTLVFNYFFNTWTVFQRTDTDGPTSSASAQDSIVVNDNYYWCNTIGRVYKENTVSAADGAYLDNGTWVTLSVESAWAKASGIAGWARFKDFTVTSEQLSPYNITLSVGEDYNSSYVQSLSWDADDIANFTGPLKTSGLQIANQKVAAIRMKISDSPPVGKPIGTGRGPRLVGLELEIALKPGRTRLPPTQLQ